MKTIQLDVQDDYVDKILSFLKLLPQNVAKIKTLSELHTDDSYSDELLSRIDDMKNSKVKPISRDELFDAV